MKNHVLYIIWEISTFLETSFSSDHLAIMLIGLAMGTGIGAFYFFYAARGQKNQIASLVYPAIGIGLFDFMSGFYMSCAWPMKTFDLYIKIILVFVNLKIMHYGGLLKCPYNAR